MLLVEDVHLTLRSSAGAVDILRGISFAVPSGTSLSIVGPSGSGKSSLLALLGGIERPSSGRVVANDTDLATLDEDGLALFRRGHMGIIFQAFHLIPTMTALENVAVGLELAGRRDAADVALRRLEEVGLAHRTDHLPSQLSGGEQQRVALARALANQPDILLADEPTGNLDGRTGGEIVDLLFKIQAERRVTLVLVTHDAALAARCARTIRLRDGVIAGDAFEAAA